MTDSPKTTIPVSQDPATQEQVAAILLSRAIEIRQQGANARAAGLDQLSNPFYAAHQMPAITGRPVEAWNRDSQAWLDGWTIEDAIRG